MVNVCEECAGHVSERVSYTEWIHLSFLKNQPCGFGVYVLRGFHMGEKGVHIEIMSKITASCYVT